MSNDIHEKREENQGMGRREFMRLSGVAVSGMVLSPFLVGCDVDPVTCGNLPVLDDYNPMVASIWVPKGLQADYYERFKAMIAEITDFSWLRPDDKVLVKLSLNSGKPYPATTDPWLLECMLKLLREKGAAHILVGDQSGAEYVVRTDTVNRGSSREACVSAGLHDVITRYNATPVFFEERVDEVGYANAYVPTLPVEATLWPKPVYVTAYLEEVDHIIYLPRVASHLIADFTSALKIGIGFLRDDSRLVLHEGGENFYALYDEINDIPQIRNKLRFVACSGRSVLRTNGPDTGEIVEPDYGLVFASDDLLAHDLLSYAWLKQHDHFRSRLSPTTINNALINAFFARVPGGTRPVAKIPEVDGTSVYCHPAMFNFMKRKGGRPSQIVWNRLNDHPDASVTDALAASLVYA